MLLRHNGRSIAAKSDEARVTFKKGEAKHRAYLVLGNSPEEVICDYSYSESGADDFGKLVDAFTESLM